jgi:hypothetical protein
MACNLIFTTWEDRSRWGVSSAREASSPPCCTPCHLYYMVNNHQQNTFRPVAPASHCGSRQAKTCKKHQVIRHMSLPGLALFLAKLGGARTASTCHTPLKSPDSTHQDSSESTASAEPRPASTQAPPCWPHQTFPR